MTKEKFDYFQKREKLSLALLKSHSQSERLNPNVADTCPRPKCLMGCSKNTLFFQKCYFLSSTIESLPKPADEAINSK